MARSKKQESLLDPASSQPQSPKPQAPAEPFTGIAYSMECYPNQGFCNYRILTLHLEKGLLVGVERSDAFAQFEAQAKLTIKEERTFDRLNGSWAPGAVWTAAKGSQ